VLLVMRQVAFPLEGLFSFGQEPSERFVAVVDPNFLKSSWMLTFSRNRQRYRSSETTRIRIVAPQSVSRCRHSSTTGRASPGRVVVRRHGHARVDGAEGMLQLPQLVRLDGHVVVRAIRHEP